MLEFDCDCGRHLKVSNDLAGWQTQCPGCQRLIDVPSPVAAPTAAAAAPKASAAIPWMGIAIGSSSVALILLVILIATAGGSKAALDEDTERTISKLKKQLADRDEEVAALNDEKAKHGDMGKLSDRAKAAEAERDKLRGQLDATTRLLDETRMKMARAERGEAPPASEEKDAPPANPLKSPEPAAAPAPLVGDVAEKCAPAVVLVNSDRDSGGGCFVAADGLVLTSYRAIAQSEVRTVTYIEGQGDGRMRIVGEAEVVAIDLKHDLALLKIQVKKLVPFVTLGDAGAAVEGDEVALYANPVPGTRSIDHVQIRGKVVSLESFVDGVAHIQTTIPLNQANAGVPVFNKKGEVVGLSTLRGEGSAVGSIAVPVVHIRTLIDGKETTFAVKGTLREWAAKNASGKPAGGGPGPKPHPTGIGVGGVLTRLHLDEEHDRILGLDVENNCVTVMSLSKRNIVRTIPTGADPVDLQITVNPDVAWVAHAESRLFLKMDVADGRIFDRIDAVRFGRFVATRNHLWTYGPNSYIVTLRDKSVVKNPIKLAALTYDRRKDRVIGLVSNWDALKLIEFDPDKVGPQLKEIADIDATGTAHPKYREQGGMIKSLESQWTTWSVPPRYEDWMPTGWTFSLLTDCTTRVMLNRFALKRNKMDAVLMRYPLVPIPATASTPMIDALKAFGRLDNFQAISPDGRWMSTGRHIINAETGAVQVELPVPTPDSKFSENSKILYVYDLKDRAIVPIEVEPKGK